MYFSHLPKNIDNLILKLSKTMHLELQSGYLSYVTFLFGHLSLTLFLLTVCEMLQPTHHLQPCLSQNHSGFMFSCILMFKRNISRSLRPVPTWFYSLSFCLMMGLMDICMNGHVQKFPVNWSVSVHYRVGLIIGFLIELGFWVVFRTLAWFFFFLPV